MITHRSMHPGWLSNSYLVADAPGGRAVLIDTGGPTEPILTKIGALQVTVTHILCTHHHVDHVQHNGEYAGRFGCPVCGHPREGLDGLDVELEDGDELVTGGLTIRALHTPGHTPGMLAFVVNEERVFTGDTLFRGSVGGSRQGSFEELRHSIMDVLMSLPGDMPVHPGHAEETTIGEEWEKNPFIRAWRGLDEPDDRRCIATGRPATLLLNARDYDGGSKCWVRFDEGNRLAVVAGSQVRVTG